MNRGSHLRIVWSSALATALGLLFLSCAATGFANEATAAPTIVREVVASRTADASTYLMSDGSFSTQIFDKPIHFLDSSGKWEPIDASLVPTETYGVTHTKSSAFDEVFASEDVSQVPVSVSHGDWSIGIKLVGGDETSPLYLGDTASYPLAMSDTQLTYQSSGTALKDSLILSSKDAPNTFTFYLSMVNISICQSPTDGYVFVDSAGRLVGHIDSLRVFDSATHDDSTDTPSDSACPGASMTVVPTRGGAFVTYSVPRSWLDDPKRVYPVVVDPVYGWQYITQDTFVGNGTALNSNFIDSDHLSIGNTGSGNVNRSLVQFNLFEIPNGATITSALFQLYCCMNNAGGNTTVCCYRATQYWGPSATWNSTFNASPPMDGTQGISKSIPKGLGYVVFDTTAIAQSWLSGSPNYGFLVRADPNHESSSGWGKQFRSLDYHNTDTNVTPHLTINWTVPSVSARTDASNYSIGATVTTTVHSTTKAASTCSDVEMSVTGSDSMGHDVNGGHLIWTSTDPRSRHPQYQTLQQGPSSFFSYDPGPDSMGITSAVIPLLSACSTTYDANGRDTVFVYKLGASYGYVSRNVVSAMDTSWGMTTPVPTAASYSTAFSVQSLEDLSHNYNDPSYGPVLVFVTGIGDQQTEATYYDDNGSEQDHAAFPPHTMTGDDYVFDDMISVLEHYYTCVKMPAQTDAKMRDNWSVQDPIGDLGKNGNYLAHYLEDNPRINTYDHWGNITSSRDVVLVCYSMGGLIARACCDGAAKHDPRLRNHIIGIVQIGTPNAGAAYTNFHKYVVPKSLRSHDIAGREMTVGWMKKYFNKSFQNPAENVVQGRSPQRTYIRFAGNAHTIFNQSVSMWSDWVVPVASVWGPVDSHGKNFLDTPVKSRNILDYGIHRWATFSSYPFSWSWQKRTSIVPQSKHGAMTNVYMKAIGSAIDKLSGKTDHTDPYYPVLPTSLNGSALVSSPMGMVLSSTDGGQAATQPDFSLGSQEVTSVPFAGGQSSTSFVVAADGPLMVTVEPSDATVTVTDSQGLPVGLQSVAATGSEGSSDDGTVGDPTSSTLAVAADTTPNANYTVTVSGGTADAGSITVGSILGNDLVVDSDRNQVPSLGSIVVTAAVGTVGGAPITVCAATASLNGVAFPMRDDGLGDDAVAGDGVYSTRVGVGAAATDTLCEVSASYQLADGVIARRDSALPVTVFTADMSIAGTPTASQLPLSNGVSDGWLIHVPVTNRSASAQAVSVACDVVDSYGNLICRPSADATIGGSTTATVDIQASGNDLYTGLGANGVVSVSRVVLTTVRNDETLQMDERTTSGPQFAVNLNQLTYQYVQVAIDSSNPATSSVVSLSGQAVSTGSSTISAVQFSLDDGTSWHDAFPTDGSFDTTVEAYEARFALPEGEWTLRVRPVSDGQPWDPKYWGEATVIVDGTAPRVTDDCALSYSSQSTMTLSASDDASPGVPSGLSYFEWSLDGGPITQDSAVGNDATDAVQTPSAGQHTLRYRVLDRAGNSSNWVQKDFVVGTPLSLRDELQGQQMWLGDTRGQLERGWLAKGLCPGFGWAEAESFGAATELCSARTPTRPVQKPWQLL